jgi:hypothetical protein
MLRVQIPLRRGVLNTTLCDKVCQCLAAGQWFSQSTPVFLKGDHPSYQDTFSLHMWGTTLVRIKSVLITSYFITS